MVCLHEKSVRKGMLYMKVLTEAWLKAAKNDLDVIDRIIEDNHLSHIVAFHAQQAVEKGF